MYAKCKRSAQAMAKGGGMEARRAKTPAHAGGLVHDSLPARARPSKVERSLKPRIYSGN